MNAVLYPSGRFLQKFQLMPRNAADIHRDIMEVKLQIYIAFAFNAKTFAIAILVLFFFFHFSFSSLFWTDCQKLFSELFIISYQRNKWPRSDSFLGHTKKSLRKNCRSSCYSRRVWHMTQLMHGNQHSQYLKKHKKQPETRKQVS